MVDKTIKSKLSVQITDYNPEWANHFIKIKKYLMQFMVNDVISIEHFGSTSVQGLAAKPIIDIHIVIKRDKLLKIKSILENCGYYYKDNVPIPDIFRFEQMNKKTTSFYRHYISICPDDSVIYIRQSKFRDYLKDNPDKRKEYERIKKEGARLYFNSQRAYSKHKKPFILSCYNEIYSNDINFEYYINDKIDISKINKLRQEEGYAEINNSYNEYFENSYFYLFCQIGDDLVGFVNIISIGTLYACINDLLVSTSYQKNGVGEMLVNIAIDKLRFNNFNKIYAFLDDKYSCFYNEFYINTVNSEMKKLFNI